MGTPGRLDLTEGGAAIEASLTGDQVAILAGAGIVNLAPGPRGGLWRVRDNGLVGAARLGAGPEAIAISIQPKITIDRLLFLIGYSQRATAWRTEEVEASAYCDLLPAVAHAFTRAAERALARGVLLGYTPVEDTVTVVRGRIRHVDQIQRWYGLMPPIEVRFDDYTADIPENRLLISATDRLLRLAGLPSAVVAGLRRITTRLPGVRRLVPGRPLPAWTPNRLNRRYHTALGLAELILRSGSFELDDTDRRVTVDGLLVTMWQVFEDFVTTAISETLRSAGGRCQCQDTSHYLDHGRRIKLKPDLVYYRPDSLGRQTPVAVVDAKYKRSADNSDIYQMLAYCSRLGLDKGHLIYAAGEADTVAHRLHTERGVTVVQHALDLSGSRESLLGRIDQIAAGLAAEGGPSSSLAAGHSAAAYGSTSVNVFA